MSTQEHDTDGQFGMNLEFSVLPKEALSDGFNRYGVRENDDGSLDVRFNAMEPGVRRGIEVTETFLDNVTQYQYGRIPVQLDHSKSQLANAGYIEPENLKFGGDFLQVQAHIPNTGSSVREDIIADFAHEPPQITDISVAFDPRSVEVESPDERGGTPAFTDAKIREFSLTPFPAGYDNGGLTAEFSEAVSKAMEEDFNDADEDAESDADSQLTTRNHNLRIRNYD